MLKREGAGENEMNQINTTKVPAKVILSRWLGVDLTSMPSDVAEAAIDKYAPIWGRKSDSWTDEEDYLIIFRRHACLKALKQYVIGDVRIPYTSRFELKINKGNYDEDKMDRNLILIRNRTCPVCGMSEKKWFDSEPAFHGLFSASPGMCRNCGTDGLVDVKEI